MTEAEWIAVIDPLLMFSSLQDRASERKARLLAVACCRRIWPLLSDARSRVAVLVAERYADEQASLDELDSAYRDAYAAYSDGSDAFYGIRNDIPVPHSVAPHGAALGAARSQLLSIRVVPDSAAYSTFYPTSYPHSHDEATRAIAPERAAQCVLIRDIFGNPFRDAVFNASWRTPNVVGIAEGIYEDRAFDRMPILADALMDAGCFDEAILTHCRGAGPHTRGCWCVDACLGKS